MDLQRRIQLAEQGRAYAELLLKNQQKLDYPNYTSLESLETGDINAYAPTKNIVFTMKPETEEEEKQNALFNLQRIITPPDAEKVIEMLKPDEISLFNQFFSKFMESIKGLKFNSVKAVKDNIITFIEKVSNKVETIKKAETNKDNSGSFKQLIENNIKYTGEDKVNHLAKGILDIYADVEINKDSMQKLINYIQHTLMVRETELKKISATVRGIKYAKNIKILPDQMTIIEYRMFLQRFGERFDIRLSSASSGKSVKSGRGMPLKKANGKGYQGAKPSERWSHPNAPQIYLDIGKLNNNILCVKYVANDNKKVELALSDTAKMIIIQMITNQFNHAIYNASNETDKKTVCFFNSMFHLINDKAIPNPIEELFVKFEILKGEIEASNDNPQIKQNLKQIALQLYKYKRINSAQLRNLFFELS